MQIRSCGDFSLIETEKDTIEKKLLEKDLSKDKIFKYIDAQHEIAKQSLVNPSYDEIFKICANNCVIKEKEKELKELKKLLMKTPRGVERRMLEDEIDAYAAYVNYLLPHDFLNALMCYALGIEKSDIKLLTEDILFEAATLATLGHNNPSDHIDGKFPKLQKQFYLDDINRRAWAIYYERTKDKK